MGDLSQKAAALGRTLDRAISEFFPLITRRLRSDQDPWINTYLEKMIIRRKKIFKLQGRSASWKCGYLDYQVEKASEKGGLGNRFAALTKPLQAREKKPNFDVKSVCTPGASNLEAAEQCADYFSVISN